MFLIGAIIVEVTGRMVLLIPRAWNRAKDEGRAEGLAQGLAEGRAAGLAEGRAVAREVGLTMGREVGLTVGRAVGREVGFTEGFTEGQAAERSRVQAILSQYARRDPATGRLILDLDQDAEERLLNGKG